MWRNALTLWEISVAAPQVIGHRTLRMASAGALPNARDRREFTRMGQEKIEAMGESAFAVGTRLWLTQETLAASLVEHWLEQAASRGQAGMAPVHRRVTSNARRLGRSRPR
jgi:hypothetical protein